MQGTTAQPDALDDVIAWRDGHIVAIDQTALPHRAVRMLDITTVDELVDAIVRLAVRGAPLLGVAGALGVALAVRQAGREGWDAARLDAEVKRIADARPTAVNLRREVRGHGGGDPAAAPPRSRPPPSRSATPRSRSAGSISERGASVPDRGSAGTVPLKVHTHCNTGALACLGWGTALGVIRALHDQGALAHVIADETRPLLQGSRLTAWELGQLGIEHYLAGRRRGAVPDQPGAWPTRSSSGPTGWRPTATWPTRSAPTRSRSPRAGPASRSWSPIPGVDDRRGDRSGADLIPLELRADEEVTHVLGVPAAPAGTRALNYAFDVTPADLVTAIVTENRRDLPRRTTPRLSRLTQAPGRVPVLPCGAVSMLTKQGVLTAMTDTMMALRAHARGGPEQLVYESAPVPVPGPGEALVAVHAAAITFAELSWDESWTTRDGRDRTPVIPSHEVSGTVAALGPGADGLAVGEEVYGLIDFDRDGAAAEYVTVPAAHLAARPRSVSDEEAASLPLAALTAWQALVDHAALEPGERVLVQGGAGRRGQLRRPARRHPRRHRHRDGPRRATGLRPRPRRHDVPGAGRRRHGRVQGGRAGRLRRGHRHDRRRRSRRLLRA